MMNTQRILATILVGMSANVFASMTDIKTVLIQKMGRTTPRFFTTHNKKKSLPVIPYFISNIRKAAPFSREVALVTYAPNYPLREVSRQDVFSVTPDGIVKKTHSVIQLANAKNGYHTTLRAITLREGTCTEINCTQQSVCRISDMSTLNVASQNIDAATKEQEIIYGKLRPQKFESLDVDALKDVAGVISACNNCQRIELITSEQTITTVKTT
jgi:hypothetical protein